MRTLTDRLEYFIESIGKTTSWLTLILVVLIGLDVMLRYVFNWNSSANQEMEWHLLFRIPTRQVSTEMDPALHHQP